MELHPTEHLSKLLADIIMAGRGEHAAAMLRAMGMERINWATNRKHIGRASTWLICYKHDDRVLGDFIALEFAFKASHHLYKAGFTAEELIPHLTLLA